MMASTRASDGSTFGSALQYWREIRGFPSLRKFAPTVHVSYTQLHRIERGDTRASRDFVTRCEQVLQTGGKLIDAWQRESGRARPRELPLAPALLVGRTRHLAELDGAFARRAVDSPPLLVIDGPAGVGKTALALKWAHRVADKFPDGQLYADLRAFSTADQPEDPARVLSWFCTSLGATGIPESLESRAALFRTLTAGARILIVLDNADDAEQVSPLLPGSASCTVIITSRRILPGLTIAHDGHRISVGPLAEADSIELVTTIIGPERADAEPSAAAELTRLCGHLPLALRVVADLADSHRQRPLADLVQDLSDDDERLDRLDTDDRTAPRTVFSRTYRVLPDSAARVFRLLSLYRGSLTASAVAALAGIPIRDARTAMRYLASVHLLDTTSHDSSPDTARLHDLLHTYAHELLAAIETPAERHAAAHRLTLWYLHAIRAAGDVIAPRCTAPLDLPSLPDEVLPLKFATIQAALAWCDRERINLPTITRMAAQYGPPGTAWRIAVALWPYLVIRRPWDTWRDTHLIAIDATETEHDDHGEAWVRAQWAFALQRQGLLDEAQRHYDHIQSLHERAGNQYGSIHGLVGAARLALDRSEHDIAQALATQAERKFVELGDLQGQARVLEVSARVHAAQGKIIGGLELLHHALNLVEPVGSPIVRGPLLTAMADINILGDDLPAALDALDRAAQEYQLIEDYLTEADLRQRAGDIHHQLHRREEATSQWNRARNIYTMLGDHQTAAALHEKIQRQL